jgi:transposase
MLEVQGEAAYSEAVAMPIKTGTWRRDFVGLERRRLEAAHLFAHGATQAEVARTVGVSAQAASGWYRHWRQGGEAALGGAGRAGRRPRLSAAELEAVAEALGKGPAAFGFDTELWTLARIAAVIEQLTGVRDHPGQVWRLLGRLGWSPQRPARRARERDEAEIARWRNEAWPRIKGGRCAAAPGAGFWTSPAVRCVRRCAGPGRRVGRPRSLPTGATGSGPPWPGAAGTDREGSRARLWFHSQPDSDNDHTLIVVLTQLRRFLRGAPATLIWDNLPSHHSRVMGAWLAIQGHWLTVEYLPAYAHDLDPVEGLWANLKGVELANLCRDTIGEVLDAARQGIGRVRQEPTLLFSFLRHCELEL